MSIVLIEPPATVEGQHEADGKAHDFIIADGVEDLPMACIVTDEPYLGKDETQEYGIHELHPEGIYECEDCKG